MEKINLNGLWKCILPDNETIEVTVPGCWDTATPIKNIGTAVTWEREFFLQKCRTKKYFLYFGGVSYYCDVFVNGMKAGSHEGMWDRFRLDVTESLMDGHNEIRLEITKPGYEAGDPFPVREVLSGFIPDVLCTFGGIWDDVWLEACDSFLIASHFARGDRRGRGQISLTVDFFKECDARVTAELFSPEGERVRTLSVRLSAEKAEQKTVVLDFCLDSFLLWDTKAPNLYRYAVSVECCGQKETVQKQFGFREISYDGSKLLLNGMPVYARGILHWGCYDDLIIPNPPREAIQDEIDKCRQFGFNMIKHCLYIPRENYLELADKNGILLWIELPLWLPDVTPKLQERIRREYPRILEQLSGHPSVVFLSLGCELDAKVDGGILKEMYDLAKSSTNALVRDNSGSGECYGGLATDYADFFDYHFYGELQNMENLMEGFTPTWRSYRPWLFGEFCDSDTMRDLDTVRKQKNTDHLFWERKDPATNPVSMLKPDFYLDKHDERMNGSGIRKEFGLIGKLSVNHSLTHRKTTLEYTRAFPEICGYNITSIRDVPIATSGIFNDLMEPKFDKSVFEQINSDVALVPAWDLARVWINGDRFSGKERYNFFSNDSYGLHVLVSNFSQDRIEAPILCWELACHDRVLLKGTQKSGEVFETGDVRELGYIRFDLPEVQKPETFVLRVSMDYDGKKAENSWPVFMYPRPERIAQKIGLYDPAGIFAGIGDLCVIAGLEDEKAVEGADMVATSRLTPKIREYAENGGRVFFVQRGTGYLPVKKVAFWREGMIRRFNHPVVEEVKYEQWFDDLRFFGVATDTAFDTGQLKRMPFDALRPVIRRYDCREWEISDYMTEIKLGKGIVLASTLRLEGGMGKQPPGISNNRFGLWLFHSAVRYLSK